MMKTKKFAWRRRSFVRLAPTAWVAVVMVCAGWIGVAKAMSAEPLPKDDALYRFAQAQAKGGVVEARSSASASALASASLQAQAQTGGSGRSISSDARTDFSSPIDHNTEDGTALPMPAIERLPLGQAVAGKVLGDSRTFDGVRGSSDGEESDESMGESGGIVGGAGGAGSGVGGKFSGKDSGMGFSWMINTVGALGIVIGLILGLRALLLRMNGQAAVGSARGAIEVLGRISVAPRQHVLLLKVGQRVLLVGESANGLRTLDTIVDPEEVADVLTRVTARQPNSATVGFSQMLSRFHGQFDEQSDFKDEGGDSGEYLVDRARDQVMNVLGRVRSMHTQFRKEST